MEEKKQRLVLGEMVWPEVEKELPNIKVAVIPVGSCEQHGPNTTSSPTVSGPMRSAKCWETGWEIRSSLRPQ